MTKLNVVNEAIEYIPKKTKEGNPVTVRVPLNDKAKEILERYKEYEGKLLPFISEQKYNDAIKKIFKLAGVDRIVTILDPVSYTHLRAHETRHDLVCRLLLEKKKRMIYEANTCDT